jgi:uncharacterized protein
MDPYLAFVRPHYADRDSAHDYGHIERIRERVEALALDETPPPSSERLAFLVAFHGLGPKVLEDAAFRDRVSVFLGERSWEAAEIDAAFASLARHLRDPVTTEERLVHDANTLEVVGAFGIAKAFLTGGARGQSIEETARIFAANLERVEMRTAAGRRVQGGRVAYAREFLRRLEGE